MWRFRAFVVLLTAAALAPGCASVGTVGPDQFHGTSGPVAWEIVYVRERVIPDEEIRWWYTIVLRETAGTGIMLERTTRSAQGARIDPGVWEEKLQERLEPNSAFRFNYEYYVRRTPASASQRFGLPTTPGGYEAVIRFHRFYGKDNNGKPLIIDIRVPLYPNVGKKS